MSELSGSKSTKQPSVYAIEQRLTPKHKWHAWVAYTDKAELSRGLRNLREDNSPSDVLKFFRVAKYVRAQP